MTSRFKGAIFDMDGTILDSMGYWRSFNVSFLAKRGLEVPEELKGCELTTHSGAAAKLFLQKFDLGMSFEEIIQEFEDGMEPLYASVIDPKPGALDCVRALKRAGLKLCVATLAPRRAAEIALRRHGILDEFEFVLATGETGLSKGGAEIFHRIAGMMNLTAKDCVVFEDSVYAMRGARSAGCAVVAIEEPAAAPDIAEIREISDVYVPDYNLFTLEALDRLDNPVSGAV